MLLFKKFNCCKHVVIIEGNSELWLTFHMDFVDIIKVLVSEVWGTKIGFWEVRETCLCLQWKWWPRLHFRFYPECEIYPNVLTLPSLGSGMYPTIVRAWIDPGHRTTISMTETDGKTQRRRMRLSSDPSKLFRAKSLWSGTAERLQSGRVSWPSGRTAALSSSWPCWPAARPGRRSWRPKWSSCGFCGVLNVPTGRHDLYMG